MTTSDSGDAMDTEVDLTTADRGVLIAIIAQLQAICRTGRPGETGA